MSDTMKSDATMSTATTSIATTSTALESAAMESTACPQSNSEVTTVIWVMRYTSEFTEPFGMKLSNKPNQDVNEEAQSAPDEGSDPTRPEETRFIVDIHQPRSIEFKLSDFADNDTITRDIPTKYTVRMERINSSGEVSRRGGSGSKRNASLRKNLTSKDNGESSKKPQGGKETQARISVIKDMEWVAITQNGQPYPEDLDARPGVEEQHVGPAATSPPLLCNIETDVFVVDRAFLSTLERPKGCDGGDEIDLFADRGNGRAESGRAAMHRRDKVLLHPKHVALNVHDPGSALVYLDLLVRAAQHVENFADYIKDHTLTFFSGPDKCCHKDCENARRQITKHTRAAGAKSVLRHPWWSFAEFCLRDAGSLTFKSDAHSRDLLIDPIIAPAPTPVNACRIRAWCHAFMNHHSGENMPGPPHTQLAILNSADLFPFLVDNHNDCLSAQRAGSAADKDRIVATIDPVVLACVFCGHTGFGMQHFTTSQLPKNSETGLMYLHYAEDEKPDEQSKGKGKERATNVQDDDDEDEDMN
ncbi:hypothetical protein F4781DRAFT_361201 [Annulohypoxylon bovei var. microspora]|nr:hypothetical protein F4781DRAFT_361201 [Annulohypoxylon bovei var. microspora]